MDKRKILIQLDSDAHASVFDRVVAIDAGADELFSYAGVKPEQVQGLIHGAIFTRGSKDLKSTAIFVGGKEESALARETAGGLHGPVCDLTGKTSLPQLAAVLSLGDLMIANDTGPLHLAVALGRPVVSPYLCTRIELTGPYRRPGSALATSVACAGSLLKQCDRLDCMNELTPGKIWPLVEEALRQWQTAHRSA